MLDKIKSLPEKPAFVIGLSLILFSPILLFLTSLLASAGKWIVIIQAIIWGIAILLILSAADKRYSRKSNTK
ncbi:hypothetical protein NSQ77_12470 [Oceanobacillus sp. FSL K6-2867]|uniref:hypothetical protein n=1 Tax=Oceanobacillus sp. FSL K6-2867 TaxID=2954748 RepID=UPI0030DB4845